MFILILYFATFLPALSAIKWKQSLGGVTMTNFDLHMHSHWSRDGEYTPTELIAMAKEKQLRYVALCDHNENRGIEEMMAEGKKEGIVVIPAMEFDTLLEGYEVHLLGYAFDYKKPYFNHLAEQIIQIMDGAMHERIVTFEKNYGISIDEAKVYENTPVGENPFFTLCEMMLNDPANQTIPDFQDYLPGGKRCDPQVPNFYWDKCGKGTKNFVAVPYPDFQKTVSLIHKNGGIAILAHPFHTFFQREDLLLKAMEYGIDGLEAYSNYHNAEQNEYYEQFAKQHHLLITCGSDFHGKCKPSIVMGEYGYQKQDGNEIIQAFLQAIKK